MQYFDFNRLINKYSCSFKVVNVSGTYNEYGEWEEKINEKDMRGAIIGISENRIYRSEGILTSKDKELFLTESLGEIDKSYVIFEGNKYSVETNPQNNYQFTGVWQYTLKWVSAFKEGDTID